ncbi:MAG: MATE family efflux transporter [Sporomusaceae bacterium]|nr:MATE family efflux transporter [Sporomusaceae bacterium]
MSENILGRENVTALFFKYAIPSIMGMVFLGVNTVVDGFFVGQYIGLNALASVNIAMPFFSLMIAIGVVVGIGMQSLVGRLLGAGEKSKADDAFKTALYLISGISFLLALFSTIFTKEIAVFLGANEQLIDLVMIYLKYEGIFLPLLGIMFVLDYVLKIMGKPIYSMQILIVAVISHMILNYCLIVQGDLGVKGAAIATGISYSIAFIMAVLPFITGQTTLKLLQGNFDKRFAYQIICNGTSEGITEICTGVTTFLFNITLMRYVGEVGVAAFTAIGYFSFVGNNILLGIADGVGSIISYNYGKGSMARVKKTLKLAAMAALFIGLGLFAVIFNFARNIILLFLDGANELVIQFAVQGAEVYAFAFLINGLNVIVSGYFTAICYPKNAAFIALSKGLVWVGIGIVILPKLLGIQGIWLTVPIAELITFILSLLLIRSHFRQVFQ